MQKARQNAIKIRALGLVFLLLSTSFTTGIAEISESASLEKFAIPASLGKIESKFIGKSDRWVIHIQDVHAHLTAQQNISALLDYLQDVYSIQTVALEGGWDETTLPKSWSLPNSRGKQAVSQALLETDYITGPVYSAIFSKQPTRLVGIEEEGLYKENRELYLQFLKNRETILEKLHVLEESVRASKQNIYNPALLQFDQALVEFRNGQKADKFIPSLFETAAAKEIDLKDLSQVQLFKKALALEKSIDQKKLEAEAVRLMKIYKYLTLPFERLLKSGKIPAEKISFYPQTERYVALTKLQEEIVHRLFFEEIETAITRLKKKMLQTNEEKYLDKRSEALILARKIMTLQATPTDLKTFTSREIDITQVIQKSGLEEALQRGLSFYDKARKRDTVFFEKIQTHPHLQGSIAVVTGGFHTEGLTQHLEDAGISYVVITPDLGEGTEPVNEALYFKRLSEDLPWKTQTLAELQNRVFVSAFDAALVARTERYEREADKNLLELDRFFTSYQVGGKLATRLKTRPKPASFSYEELKPIIEFYLDPENSKKKITMVIRQSVLVELTKDKESLASKVWKQVILSNPLNTIVLIQAEGDKAYTDTEGGAVFKTARGELGIVAEKELRKMMGRGGKIGVIDDQYQAVPDSNIISLKPEAAALVLLRALLENDPKISLSNIDYMMENAIKILQEYFQNKAIRTAA